MTAWRVVLGAVLVTTLAAAGAACMDIFHSTSDLKDACEIDPSTPGCREICEPRAEAVATRACAWLGACEGPIGRNALGPCVVQARLAYDCSANPNHPFKGQAARLWACLAKADGCDSVDRCIFPDGKPVCSQVGSSCVGSQGAGVPPSVRLECAPGTLVDGGNETLEGGAEGEVARAEDCALFGQICSMSGDAAVCTGSAGTTGCTDVECLEDGSAILDWCSPTGMDLGVDCASNGAQRCGGYPTASAPDWVACAAQSNTTCDPSLVVSCAGDVSTSCPSGLLETLDCAALLGKTGTCVPGTLDPSFDWSSRCMVPQPECSADVCDDAGGLVACMRGATLSVDCTAQGLSPCEVVDLDGGTGAAACSAN